MIALAHCTNLFLQKKAITDIGLNCTITKRKKKRKKIADEWMSRQCIMSDLQCNPHEIGSQLIRYVHIGLFLILPKRIGKWENKKMFHPSMGRLVLQIILAMRTNNLVDFLLETLNLFITFLMHCMAISNLRMCFKWMPSLHFVLEAQCTIYNLCVVSVVCVLYGPKD